MILILGLLVACIGVPISVIYYFHFFQFYDGSFEFNVESLHRRSVNLSGSHGMITVVYYIPFASWFWFTWTTPAPDQMTLHHMPEARGKRHAASETTDGEDLELKDASNSSQDQDVEKNAGAGVTSGAYDIRSKGISSNVGPALPSHKHCMFRIRNESSERHRQLLLLSDRLIRVVFLLMLPRLIVTHVMEEKGSETLATWPFLMNLVNGWLFYLHGIISPILVFHMNSDFRRILIGTSHDHLLTLSPN